MSKLCLSPFIVLLCVSSLLADDLPTERDFDVSVAMSKELSASPDASDEEVVSKVSKLFKTTDAEIKAAHLRVVEYEFRPAEKTKRPINSADRFLAISKMLSNYPDLKKGDLAIVQKGDEINLVVVVGAASNVDYAKKAGDFFLRMCKRAFRDGAQPSGKDIGTGEYNYLIGVYTQTERKLALGVKTKSGKAIRW